jgi:hypothetical protein
LETLAELEAKRIPLELIRSRLAEGAPELAKDVIEHVTSQFPFPPEFTDTQKKEVHAACVRRFTEYFNGQIAVATEKLDQANTSRPN